MSIEKIAERMSAIMAAADARPVEERSLSDDEVAEYEQLEEDLQKENRNIQLRKRHAAYKTPIVQGTITADAKGDQVLERAFEHYLRTGVANADLVELRAQGEGSGAAGAYTVPDLFRQKLTEITLSFGGIQSVAEVITTDSGAPLEWPSLNDTTNSAEIVAESGSPASAGADLTFGTVTLGAYKYVSSGASNTLLKVPHELAQDSAFDIGGLVARKLGERIARKMAADFAAADGSSKPQGLAYSADGDGHVELADGNAITYAKLLATVKALDPSYRTNARWVMDDATWMAIAELTDGTGGRPLIQSASAAGISGSVESMPLLGYPVTIDNGMFAYDSGTEANNDNKVLAVFGDISEAYIIRRVREVQVVVDPYSLAVAGQIGYLAWARADGKQQNTSAFVRLSGYDATA